MSNESFQACLGMASESGYAPGQHLASNPLQAPSSHVLYPTSGGSNTYAAPGTYGCPMSNVASTSYGNNAGNNLTPNAFYAPPQNAPSTEFIHCSNPKFTAPIPNNQHISRYVQHYLMHHVIGTSGSHHQPQPNFSYPTNTHQGPVTAEGSLMYNNQQPSTTTAAKQHSPQEKSTRCGMACTLCRARKQKCSGEPGGCQACQKLGLECKYEPVPEKESQAVKKKKEETKALKAAAGAEPYKTPASRVTRKKQKSAQGHQVGDSRSRSSVRAPALPLAAPMPAIALTPPMETGVLQPSGMVENYPSAEAGSLASAFDFTPAGNVPRPQNLGVVPSALMPATSPMSNHTVFNPPSTANTAVNTIHAQRVVHSDPLPHGSQQSMPNLTPPFPPVAGDGHRLVRSSSHCTSLGSTPMTLSPFGAVVGLPAMGRRLSNGTRLTASPYQDDLAEYIEDKAYHEPATRMAPSYSHDSLSSQDTNWTDESSFQEQLNMSQSAAQMTSSYSSDSLWSQLTDGTVDNTQEQFNKPRSTPLFVNMPQLNLSQPNTSESNMTQWPKAHVDPSQPYMQQLNTLQEYDTSAELQKITNYVAQ